MKKSIFLAFAVLAIFTAAAQIEAKPTGDLAKVIYDSKNLKIHQIGPTYSFYYYDAVTRNLEYFNMDNKESAQDLLDLSMKMLTDKNLSDSYTFQKPGFRYTLEWFQKDLVLYVIPNIGRAHMWIIKSKDIAAVNL